MSAAPGTFYADCMAEKRIELCESARVILLYNLDLDSVGELKLKNGDTAGARAAFEEAVEIREKTATISTPAGLIVKTNLQGLDAA